ncbi:hypothetical protein ABZ135_01425 [Streptomyces sp. NPDC006339]|uniref:hypothetical protein n=1 Tax=Streptomyces sp. NPDC006339 TaxID=3156755 RepID=UPI00339F6B28
MASHPDPTVDLRDQHIAELRSALQRAIPLMSFTAGLEAAVNPKHADLMMAAAKDFEGILARTNPQ